MKSIKLLAACMLTLASCAPKEKTSYTIEGNVNGIPDSTILVIRPLAHQETAPIAEAVVKGGKFKFEGKAEEPQPVSLTVKGHYGNLMLMLENADIKIDGDVTSEETPDGKIIYGLSNLSISGSPLYEEYLTVMAPRYEIDSMMISNSRSHKQMMDRYYAARNEGRNDEADSISNTTEFKDFLKTEEKCFAAFDSVLTVTVENNRDKIWGPIVMLTQLSYVSGAQRPLYDLLSDSIKNTPAAKTLYKELYPAGVPGEKIKDFSIEGTSFSELYKGKKAVILDFWASWCRPCRAEIPNLKEIYNKWNEKGLEIVSISIDDDESAWKKALDSEKLPWLNYRDADDAVARLYQVTAVPTMYVIDGDGILLLENQRGTDLANAIDSIMAKD